MFIDKNKQQALAEGTEIVVKAAIDALDKNAPSIAKAIFSFLDAIKQESEDQIPEESDIEDDMEKISEFLSTLIGSSIKKQMKDGFGPAGYV
jgi:hypothetical protein